MEDKTPILSRISSFRIWETKEKSSREILQEMA